MTVALYVVIGAATVATIACAISVFVWSRISDQARRLRSTISLQGELIEIRDYVAKIDAWAKRINAREVMFERRSDTETQSPARSRAKRSDSETDLNAVSKTELRAHALASGQLVPGRVPRHGN